MMHTHIQHAQVITFYIKNFYLETPMEHAEYVCASISQISLKSSLMNTTSLNTHAMDGYISKSTKDATSCHRMENCKRIFSASTSSNIGTMKLPQPPDSGVTNGAQLFWGSLSTTSGLNTLVNYARSIYYKPFSKITPSPHIGRGGNLGS